MMTFVLGAQRTDTTGRGRRGRVIPLRNRSIGEVALHLSADETPLY